MRISDGDLTIALTIAVGFQISRSCFDVWCDIGTIAKRNDLIANEQSSSVVELMKLIHYSSECIFLACGPRWTDLFDLRGEGIEIDEKIDASIRKGGHASRVVTSVDMIDTDGVRAEPPHELRISLALSSVDEWIVG